VSRTFSTIQTCKLYALQTPSESMPHRWEDYILVCSCVSHTCFWRATTSGKPFQQMTTSQAGKEARTVRRRKQKRISMSRKLCSQANSRHVDAYTNKWKHGGKASLASSLLTAAPHTMVWYWRGLIEVPVEKKRTLNESCGGHVSHLLLEVMGQEDKDTEP